MSENTNDEPESARAGSQEQQTQGARHAKLDARGRERPRFLLDYPDDPRLQELCRAFERGDFATVRREAPKLAEATDDENVRQAARELRQRVDIDPLIYVLLAMALGLLLFVIAWTYIAH